MRRIHTGEVENQGQNESVKDQNMIEKYYTFLNQFNIFGFSKGLKWRLLAYILDREFRGIIEQLVQSGCKFDVQPAHQPPLLLRVIRSKNVDFVKYLMDLGVDFNQFHNGCNLSFYALKFKKVDVFRFLCRRDVFPEASHSNCFRLFKQLIEEGNLEHFKLGIQSGLNMFSHYSDEDKSNLAIIALINKR